MKAEMTTYRCPAGHTTLYDPDSHELHIGSVAIYAEPTTCRHYDIEPPQVCGQPLTPYCRGCGKELTLCPMCHGSDPTDYAAKGQVGYYVCQDDDCDEYQYCCGC